MKNKKRDPVRQENLQPPGRKRLRLEGPVSFLAIRNYTNRPASGLTISISRNKTKTDRMGVCPSKRSRYPSGPFRSQEEEDGCRAWVRGIVWREKWEWLLTKLCLYHICRWGFFAHLPKEDDYGTLENLPVTPSLTKKIHDLALHNVQIAQERRNEARRSGGKV